MGGGSTCSEMFLYHYMFPRHAEDDRPKPASGPMAALPTEEGPCPSCKGLLDQLDGAIPHVEAAGANFAAVAKAPLDRRRSRSTTHRHDRAVVDTLRSHARWPAQFLRADWLRLLQRCEAGEREGGVADSYVWRTYAPRCDWLPRIRFACELRSERRRSAQSAFDESIRVDPVRLTFALLFPLTTTGRPVRR